VVREPTNDVYVAPSKIDRLGLFLSKTTKKGTIVTEYIGEVISEAMADVREKKFHFGCYMFALTKNNTRSDIIDATFVGNMARYLNHSCDVLLCSLSRTARRRSRW
jgi:[histone H3]-lysine4 N-trimethyltransferase SETD1